MPSKGQRLQQQLQAQDQEEEEEDEEEQVAQEKAGDKRAGKEKDGDKKPAKDKSGDKKAAKDKAGDKKRENRPWESKELAGLQRVSITPLYLGGTWPRQSVYSLGQVSPKECKDLCFPWKLW